MEKYLQEAEEEEEIRSLLDMQDDLEDHFYYGFLVRLSGIEE